ncbi:MAG: cysteine dioxygenase family protein [Planctomycetes bacterium]|nr:cysteine dioxygenase family protein [Planctomycetota bacterium]
MTPTPLDRLIEDVGADLTADLTMGANGARGPRVAELVSRYARAHDDWRTFALFDSQRYARNLVHKDELFELILLCWDLGQVTPIHDHQGQRCWMGVLDGRVEEILYAPPEGGTAPRVRGSKEHERGAVAFITDDIALHRIAQVGTARAVSLHLYSRPIPVCRIFDPATGVVADRTLTYHSIRGVRVEPDTAAR